MYKILIKYDNDKLNLWMPYGTTTTSTTGNSEFTEFETESKDELEGKCIELLNSYRATDFIPIDTLKYTTDLVWTTEG